ncbi:hypothetical protein F4803DRAFT_575235 [Xylaria telfairii]|nr:hypothetical protein F4803DRAFT_575235 [Xylaria telfairii]
MSGTKFVSPPKSDPRVNLDHLIISVQSRTGQNADYALNEFLSDAGRQSRIRNAKDYDYHMLRGRLQEILNIDDLAPLYPPRSALIRITNAASFHDFLTRVQKGQTPAPDSDIYGLPYLEFTSKKPPAGQLTPQGPVTSNDATTGNRDDSVLDTPTRPRPSRPRPLAGKPIAAPATKDPDEDEYKDGEDNNDLTQDDPAQKDPAQEDPAQEEPRQRPDPGDEVQEHQDEGSLIMDELGGRNETPEEEWERACQFFRCSINDKDIFVPGLSLRLLPYQAFAVWRVFIQVAEKSIPSFMLGDAPGLGKTGSE